MDSYGTDPADRPESGEQETAADARGDSGFEDGVPQEGEMLAWQNEPNPEISSPTKPRAGSDTSGEAKELSLGLEVEGPVVEAVPAIEAPQPSRTPAAAEYGFGSVNEMGTVVASQRELEVKDPVVEAVPAVEARQPQHTPAAAGFGFGSVNKMAADVALLRETGVDASRASVPAPEQAAGSKLSQGAELGQGIEPVLGD
ncbi:hypothetical protein ACFFTQ_26025 [Streptomyces roseofulvus]|uniref:hypothetical protein n=1 Tax=Streptomyces roseofulvus TaxID=33902 RepID=UPI0031FE21E7